MEPGTLALHVVVLALLAALVAIAIDPGLRVRAFAEWLKLRHMLNRMGFPVNPTWAPVSICDSGKGLELPDVAPGASDEEEAIAPSPRRKLRESKESTSKGCIHRQDGPKHKVPRCENEYCSRCPGRHEGPQCLPPMPCPTYGSDTSEPLTRMHW